MKQRSYLNLSTKNSGVKEHVCILIAGTEKQISNYEKSLTPPLSPPPLFPTQP